MKGKDKEESQLSPQLKNIMNDLKCVNDHLIRRVCDQPQCQFPALFCNQKECAQCAQMHRDCRSYTFEKFSKLVQKRSEGTISQFLQKVIEIETSLIDSISKQKRKLSSSFSIDENTFNMDKKYFKMIEDIYRHRNSQSIKGMEACELFQKLQQSQIQMQSREGELLETFTQQAERVMKEYMQVKDWIYDSALGQGYKRKIKEKEETVLIDSPTLVEKNLQMTLKTLISSSNRKVSMFSRIIQQQLENQDRIFLKEIFNIPTIKLEPVFKASDNEFRASRFHQVCDHIENTFIIFKNEFGKTFGGFTSLTWFGDNIFKDDDLNSSFLVSFDEKIKMSLTSRSKAIYCSQSVGPTFGGETNYIKFFQSYDLLIGDRCNVTNSSYYQFPRSYQFFQRSSEGSNIFGVDRGKKFKILQYEVFKVSA